ncbi:MAG: sugar-binding transcriptional regulator [Blautia sp.]|jgi:DNA-binding transcriptional regulator LsrR (DeoR family)
MKIDKYDQSTFLVLKAAYQYYIQEKSQNLIAEELGVSITTVSRLLKRAKDEKIIEFVIRNPYVECLKLEQELRSTFGLKDVVIGPVVDITEENGDDVAVDAESVKKLVALEGARYLQRIIKENDVLGVTWGSTVYHMINYLNPAQKANTSFVTLHGSLSNCVNEWDVRTLVSRMAKAFSGNKHTLLTDTLMGSPETVKILKKEKSIAQVMEMFDRVNVAVNGIGALYPKTTSILATPQYLTHQELQKLQEKGVVGDIALRFLNQNGEECDTDLKERTISIELEQFRRIPLKITLASGVEKAHAIRAALRGGLIDVLIVDSKLGEALLDLARYGL